MKKALLALIGAGVVASVASFAVAQDAAVANSANAVGVVKYSIPSNTLLCLSLPLNSMDDSQWVWTNNSFSAQLPNNSTVYFWDGYSWSASTKSRRGWDGVGATKVLDPGEAFFIKGLTDADTTVSLLGELPVDDTLTFSIRGGGNYDTRTTSMYPVSEKFSTSSMAASLPEGASVYFWDGFSWSASTKSRRGWDGVGATHTNAIGEGVFIRVSAAGERDVSMERPFEWQ